MNSGGSSGVLSKEASPDVHKSPSALMETSTISDPGAAPSKFRTSAATVMRSNRVVDRLKVSDIVWHVRCDISWLYRVLKWWYVTTVNWWFCKLSNRRGLIGQRSETKRYKVWPLIFPPYFNKCDIYSLVCVSGPNLVFPSDFYVIITCTRLYTSVLSRFSCSIIAAF